MEAGRMPMSILLVEDEPHLRRALARSLASRGYAVDEAASRGEAVRAALARPPTLMLLDINLPDASGWDVLRDLAEQGRTTPTVIMSAAPPNPNRVREFAPFGVLTKPFPLDALLRFIRQLEPGAVAPTPAWLLEEG
ncbi:MAG TPA: response regulator [Thermomicrobiales bacterium]|jgi:DNA-binding response OmpR family regulator|nr:response regulator [Thermomicrobiales bacterium]